MSLINDALNRTKQAQQQTPPAAGGPELKPVGPAAAKTAGGSKTLLYIMVACVVVGNALIFIYYFTNERAKRTPAASLVTTPAIATNVVAARIQAPVAQPVPGAVAAPSGPVAVAETNAPALVGTSTAPVVAAVPLVPETPKPAPLKLQSIIYNPGRPSAMVSGKFLFIGDKVQGFRVTAIDQESVTLVGNGQTNVLSLP